MGVTDNMSYRSQENWIVSGWMREVTVDEGRVKLDFNE